MAQRDLRGVLDQDLREGYDTAARYREEVARFEHAVRDDLAAAHRFMDGKWLVEHMAVARTGQRTEDCRSRWCDHARAQGGHAEVKALWQRIKRGASAPPP